MRRDKLTVLIVDGGGRGHALYDAVNKSPLVKKVYVGPGNAGIPPEDRIKLDMNNVEQIAEKAYALGVDLIVAGSEVSLVAGLKEACDKFGIAMFGPSRNAAQLEGSKWFAKRLMEAAGLMDYTGLYRMANSNQPFTTVKSTIRQSLKDWGAIPVIKADGLCGGMGVTVPSSLNQAFDAAYRSLVNGELGEAGKILLIEERLEGPECSFHAFCDGVNAYMLLPTRDHKRLSADPDAPNTGGMGAYAPVSEMQGASEFVRDEIIRPVLRQMATRGTPYHGVIYVGMMLTKDGWKVIEFNCRFGDPECQVILPLMVSDIVEYMLASLTFGGLAELPPPKFKKGAAVCVVATAKGYPGEVKKGDEILFDRQAWNDNRSGMRFFHAGTAQENGKYFIDGGRVLNSVAMAGDVAHARALAYENLKHVSFPGMYNRTDIAENV